MNQIKFMRNDRHDHYSLLSKANCIYWYNLYQMKMRFYMPITSILNIINHTIEYDAWEKKNDINMVK